MRLSSSLAPLPDFFQDGAALSSVVEGHGAATRSALDRDERRRPAQFAIVGARGPDEGGPSRGVTDRLPLLLKAGEVANLLGISRSTAFVMMASRELPVIRIPRSVRVRRDALYGWIRRSDGRWEAKIDVGWQGGRLRRKSIYGQTRREVHERLVAALKAQGEGRLVAGKMPTVGQFLQQWLEVARPGLRPKAYPSYEGTVRLHTRPFAGSGGDRQAVTGSRPPPDR